MQYHQSESHHKELAACTDEQLCAMAAAGDREAEELLVTRYYGMVRACARPLFLAGGDGEDLIQEGMFGLIQAIREYDAGKTASFRTYAETCIRNRLFSALRAPPPRRPGGGGPGGGGAPVRIETVEKRYFFRYLSSQPKNSRFQTTEFWGFITWWSSSSNSTRRASIPCRRAAVKASSDCV